jgi:maleylpyruvate isomerase
MSDATAFVDHLVEGADDDCLEAPSRLPGWRRGHVLSHLARNADALSNLLTWARTGVETPMYESAARRDGDIELGARRPAAAILADYHDANGRLGRSLGSLPASAWEATVSTNSGRSIEIRELPWLRARELWMHAIDLDLGPGFADLPDATCTALVGFVTENLTAQPACPILRLEPDDGAPAIDLGPPNGRGVPAKTVQGSEAELLGWASGRSDGAALTVLPEGPLPVLPTGL